MKRINVLAGSLSHADDYDACIAMYIENIRYAAEYQVSGDDNLDYE
ncbi:hypothetical protein [Oceanospirillum sp.]